uniref:Ferredoxin-like protein in vnf region n=1 Tax=Azotobacter vinelandii TaxID=354 RepID=FERV_AZOVI|nr:RecName: Full=Ferredoxin-like protein in vnf region [Azotobacter vinelandii]CAA31868.1 ferredoxin-like protein [Azotobacter vinelandii]
MAMAIDGYECTVCGDCEPVCPTGSIVFRDDHYAIEADSCNECTDVGEPRCLGVCPVDLCIQPLDD